MYNIAVIGAGVVGLSTALNIQKVLPDAKVRIVADKFSRDTTSYGAGGIFLPTMSAIAGVPRERLRKWVQNSWDFYSSLALSSKASETGHMVAPGYVPCNSKNEEDRVYKDIVFSYREMTKSEMEKINITQFKYCYQITTLITTVRVYLPWLIARFRENGGEIEHKRIEKLEELVDKYDMVVNCTGFGSKKLFNDKKLYSIRGQMVRIYIFHSRPPNDYPFTRLLRKIQAPWIKYWCYPDNGTYVIVNQDTVALGGVKQVGNENEEINAYDSKKIIDGCLQVLPSLTGYKLDHEWVGLRPARSPLRLESEIIKCQNGTLKVVHNYGHGSNGICLSWGTSLEAAQLVKDVLTRPSASKL